MKCVYKKTNGDRCGANSMKDSKFCFVHNPKTREEHSLAVIKRGKLSKKGVLDIFVKINYAVHIQK